jgi:hypothetical protein
MRRWRKRSQRLTSYWTTSWRTLEASPRAGGEDSMSIDVSVFTTKYVVLVGKYLPLECAQWIR